MRAFLALLLLTSIASACPKGTKRTSRREDGKVYTFCVEKTTGQPHGPVVIKDAKGNLLTAGQYRHGQRAGSWTLIRDGKAVGYDVYRDGVLVEHVESQNQNLPSDEPEE